MTDEPAQPQGESKPENWAEGARHLDENQLQALLKEYEGSAMTINHLTSLLWISSALVVLLTAAGAGYLLINVPADVFGVLLVGAAAGFGLALLACCWLLQHGWSALIGVHVYRRLEIESELGLLANRYADCLEAAGEGRQQMFPPAESEAEAFASVERSFQGMRTYPQIVRRIRVIILILAALTWGVTLVLQLLSVFIYCE